MPYEKLSRALIMEALSSLGRLAQAEGVQLEIHIYGGAALMLALNAREATKDLDAVIRPSEIGHRLARKVGDALGLPEDWLNDDVKQFLSEKDRDGLIPLESAPMVGVTVKRPSASYLLAMKVLASRTPLPGYAGDVADIAFLCQKMSIRTIGEVERHLDRFYPHEVLSERARAVLAGIFEAATMPQVQKPPDATPPAES
jgi:hypothetical protein